MRSPRRIAIELASPTCRFVDSDRILCETRMTNCSASWHPFGGALREIRVQKNMNFIYKNCLTI